MKCEICGKLPTKRIVCTICAHVAAYVCDGFVCQPKVWRTGLRERRSCIALMNLECEECGSSLVTQELPDGFKTPFKRKRMFGFIGTYLMHDYKDLAPYSGAGWRFAVAHFLKRMAPNPRGWTCMVNVSETNPKEHANRPLIAMMPSGTFPGQSEPTIVNAAKWVDRSFKAILPSNMDSVPTSFYTSAMVVSANLANTTTVPNTNGIPQGLQGQQNFSSRTTKGQIDDVVSYMRDPNIQANIGWPAFSVWDCNCFHNTGYLMGKYALDSALSASKKTHPPLLVVNIDQHSDAGTSGQTVVSSDRWGKALIENYRNSAYLSVTSGGTGSGHQIETHYRAGVSGVKSLKGLSISPDNKFNFTDIKMLFGNDAQDKKEARDKLTAYWRLLLEKIYPLEQTRPPHFEFVFMTIDRDCMKDNHNQWGDSKSILENYGEVNSVADAILGTLVATGTRVVGLDVTGLPEDNSKVDCNGSRTKKPNIGNVLSDVKRELSALQATFRTHTTTKP